jgi:hypothetical protein
MLPRCFVSRRFALAAALVTAVCCLALAMPTFLSAQQYTYPHCYPMQLGICPDCDGIWMPTVGCTAPPPSSWYIGFCDSSSIPGNCEQRVYNCGEGIFCELQIFTNSLCGPNWTICRPAAL